MRTSCHGSDTHAKNIQVSRRSCVRVSESKRGIIFYYGLIKGRAGRSFHPSRGLYHTGCRIFLILFYPSVLGRFFHCVFFINPKVTNVIEYIKRSAGLFIRYTNLYLYSDIRHTESCQVTYSQFLLLPTLASSFCMRILIPNVATGPVGQGRCPYIVIANEPLHSFFILHNILSPPSLLRGNDPLDLPLGLETIPVLFTDTLTSLVTSNQRQQNLFYVAWKMGL